MLFDKLVYSQEPDFLQSEQIGVVFPVKTLLRASVSNKNLVKVKTNKNLVKVKTSLTSKIFT